MSVTTLTKKQLISFITLAILVFGLIAALFAVRKIQELRRKAAVPGGPAAIIVSPGSTTFTEGQPVTLSFQATIQTLPVDGFQIVADLTGTIPPDFTFTPTTPSGLELAYQQLIPTPEGKQLQLAYVTQNPSDPMRTGVTLGNITFTAPSSGSMTFAFDSTESIITQNQTAQDILGIPEDQTYTFITTPVTPPESPSPPPSPIPSPSPSPSLSPVTPPEPSPLPICNVADINKDGTVNSTDRSLLVQDYFSTSLTNSRSDINSDDRVDLLDYSLLVKEYNQTTGPCQ